MTPIARSGLFAAIEDRVEELEAGRLLHDGEPVVVGQGDLASGEIGVLEVLPRKDHDVGHADALELGRDDVVETLDDGNHRDHRRDADDDAEHGQQRAHLVGADGLQRDAEVVPDHWFAGVTWSVAQDLAVEQADGSAGVFRDVLLVGDEDDGVAGLVELVEEGHDLFRCLRIEVAGGFVGEKNRRPVDQRPGHRHPLSLAAGQFVGLVFDAVGQSNPFEGLERPLPAFGGGHSCVDQGQFDIGQSGRPVEQVESLKDKADFLIADVGELGVIEPRDGLSVEHVLSAGRCVETTDEIHQGGLAGARRAHDGEVVAGCDLEIDAVEGPDLNRAHEVDLAKLGDGDQHQSTPTSTLAEVSSSASSSLPLLLCLSNGITVLELLQRPVGSDNDLLAFAQSIGDLDMEHIRDPGHRPV